MGDGALQARAMDSSLHAEDTLRHGLLSDLAVPARLIKCHQQLRAE